MRNLIQGKAGGFFTPQEEGGKCKLTIIFEDRASQDQAFLMRYQDVVIGLASENGEAHQEEGPTRIEVLRGMQQYLSEEIEKEAKRLKEVEPLFAGEVERGGSDAV